MTTKKQDLLKYLGDPREVDRDIQSFRQAAKVLSSRYPRLIEKYPKQWIVVYRGRVQARGRTFSAAMKQADEKRLPRQHIIVRYIDKNKRTMILRNLREGVTEADLLDAYPRLTRDDIKPARLFGR